MTTWLSALWIALLAIPVGWAVSVVVAALLACIPADRRLDPAVRIRRLYLVAALPWVVPLVLLLALVVPAAAKPLGLIADHCLSHGLGHPHLCLEHLPALALAQWHWFVVGLGGAWFALSALRHAMRQRTANARLRAITSLARGRGPLRVLETGECVVFAADPGAPVVLISRGLLDRLAPRERRIVLAHEAAHLRQRDPAQSRLLEWLLLAHWPGAAVRLRRAWHQAVEERADDAVAERFGAEPVARTIVEVVRATSGRDVPAFSAAGADTVLRIERLLAGFTAARPRPVYETVYGMALATAAVALVASHHAVETLLGMLL